MRAREKLTVEEKIAIALDLIKRERSLDEIREHYRVSHTTVYKIRNAFLEGGRRALGAVSRGGVDKKGRDLEARVRALEKQMEPDPQHRVRNRNRGARADESRIRGVDSRVR